MAVFGHEEDRFKTNIHLSFVINSSQTKSKFVFKKKHTLAVSGHIIFHFKMNLILVETFVEKYIYFTKRYEWKKQKKN